MPQRFLGSVKCLPLFGVGRGQTGFTLLEVMVSVAIIAMSFVALLSSQSQSISIASISRFETTASLLARQKLAEIELAGFDQLGSESGAFEDDYADYSWEIEVTELTEEDTGIKGSNELLKRVELKVGRGNEQAFTVRTIIMVSIQPSEEE